jgi:hypothetical protein
MYKSRCDLLCNTFHSVLISGGDWKFFSSPPRPERLWGPPSLLSNGYQGLSLGIKRPGREADHSPPSSAEVKECLELYFRSPNTPSWRGAHFKKAQGQLYFYFTFFLGTALLLLVVVVVVVVVVMMMMMMMMMMIIIIIIIGNICSLLSIYCYARATLESKISSPCRKPNSND